MANLVFMKNLESRWTAVQTRDSSMDGVFVYAVKTTGIYCQPSCSSRLPNQKNVEFFDTPEIAESAGYRQCKRCWSRVQNTQNIIAKIIARLEDESSEPSLAVLGELVELSPWHVQRIFKAALGVSPKQYLKTFRAKRLRQELKTNSVTRALYEAGFNSSSRIYEAQTAQLGMKPTAYKSGGAAQLIFYTHLETGLGGLLLAATERGLVSVQFGLVAQTRTNLQNEFPNARLEENPDLLAAQSQAILEHLLGQNQDLNLPTDVKTTVFQSKVWSALKSIPYGQTRSYSEVAAAIGQPTAVRAVARACATNPVALIVPCHRVIGAGGALSGYRWGLERKKALLEQEATQAREVLL